MIAGASPIAPKSAAAIAQFPSRAGMIASAVASTSRKTRNCQLPSETGRGNEKSSLPASALTASPQQQHERAQPEHVDRRAARPGCGRVFRTEVASHRRALTVGALRLDEARVERASL